MAADGPAPLRPAPRRSSAGAGAVPAPLSPPRRSSPLRWPPARSAGPGTAWAPLRRAAGLDAEVGRALLQRPILEGLVEVPDAVEDKVRLDGARGQPAQRGGAAQYQRGIDAVLDGHAQVGVDGVPDEQHVV